jgi:hypothetical protein
MTCQIPLKGQTAMSIETQEVTSEHFEQLLNVCRDATQYGDFAEGMFEFRAPEFAPWRAYEDELDIALQLAANDDPQIRALMSASACEVAKEHGVVLACVYQLSGSGPVDHCVLSVDWQAVTELAASFRPTRPTTRKRGDQ